MGRYTHGHHESVLRSHRRRDVDNSAGYLADRLAPGTSLLDVGCGPGTLTVDLARRVAPGRVVGIDSSEGIVRQAAQDLPEGVANVEFRVGDVYALGFGDGVFDIVHAHQVLQHVHDPVGALREMGRMCRPGGIVAARDADYGAMTWHPSDDRLDRWLAAYRAVAVANGGQPDAGRYLPEWAQDAGFTDVKATTSSWQFTTPGDRAWWGGLWADRVVESSLAECLIEGGHANQSGLEEFAAAWLDWARQPDGWFIVPHGEIIASAM
jgi:ubiquinone/menaquinone biosynthesis C-methylase UbiE